MVRVTVTPETPCPWAFCTRILIAGVICALGDVLLGWTAKLSVNAGAIVMLSGFAQRPPAGDPESAACTAKANVPKAAGVPLMVPALLRARPAGKGPEPGLSDQARVPMPPPAERIWL